MSVIMLQNALYFDQDKKTFKKTDIEVEQGLGGGLRFNNPGTVTEKSGYFINCEGMLVTKSFVNAHHHIYSALARGMPPPVKRIYKFTEILENIWWKLDRSLTKEMINISAAVSAIDSLKSGVTFIIDHHSSPNSIDGSLESISETLKKSGIKSVVCYEMSDRDGEKSRDEGVYETEKILQSEIPALVGLHASFTVSDILMKRAVKLAEKYDSGIHIHLSESEDDNLISLKRYKKRALMRLSQFGALNFSKTLLAHAIHITEEERRIIASSKAYVVRNPRSNLNNGVGMFRDHMLEDKVLLGTDGIDSDVLADMKEHFYQKCGGESGSPGYSFNCLSRADNYLKNSGFAKARGNDLLIFKYGNPTEINGKNIYSHFIYGIKPANIEYVISDGKIVVDKKKVVSLDEEEIYKESRKLAKTLWKRMEMM